MMPDIYLVGVGGQGIITASRIIGDAAILANKKVILSETHGMAQRGGSVACTARIGDVQSPLIPDGRADLILSFELLETLRAMCKANKDTKIVSSSEKIVPLSVSTQRLKYPLAEQVSVEVKKVVSDFVLVNSRKLAEDAGAPMSSNIVMVGALAGTGVAGIARKHFEEAIGANLPRGLNQNLAAFENGFRVTAKSGKS
jgi:indolepyruvate ferredoxin oxidoreductase beta subunit